MLPTPGRSLTISPLLRPTSSAKLRHLIKLCCHSADAKLIVVIIAVTTGLGLLALPTLDSPLYDEPNYVSAAVRLAESGELVLGRTVDASVVAHVVWGAGFLRLFGGSFVTLRLAMLLASALSAAVFYILLRQLGFSRTSSTIGVGAFAFNLFFVFSSVVFMTEALFVLCVLGTLAVGLAGLRRGRVSLLLAATVLASIAFLTRQIGIVLVAVLMLALLGTPCLRRSLRAWVVLLLPPAVIVAVFVLWRYGPSAPAGTGLVFMLSLYQWSDGSGLAKIANRLTLTLPYLGLFTLPLVVVFTPQMLRQWARHGNRVSFTLVGVFLVGAIAYALQWARGIREFPYMGGILLGEFEGHNPMPFQPHDLWMLAGTIMLWSVGCFVLGLVFTSVRWSPTAWWHHPHFPVYCTGLLLLFSTFASYIIYDRYYFPLLPFAIAAFLAVSRHTRPSLPLALVMLGLLATSSLIFMDDYRRRAALGWEIGHDLLQRGTPENAIDGGFHWANWWRLWREYPIGAEETGELGPLRGRGDRPYRITAAPLPGYEIERQYPYWTPLGWHTEQLYVLRRTDLISPDAAGQ